MSRTRVANHDAQHVQTTCHWRRVSQRDLVSAMRRFLILVVVAMPGMAHAQKWQDATAECLARRRSGRTRSRSPTSTATARSTSCSQMAGITRRRARRSGTDLSRTQAGVARDDCSEISAEAVGGFTACHEPSRQPISMATAISTSLTGGAYQTQAKLFMRDGRPVARRDRAAAAAARRASATSNLAMSMATAISTSCSPIGARRNPARRIPGRPHAAVPQRRHTARSPT